MLKLNPWFVVLIVVMSRATVCLSDDAIPPQDSQEYQEFKQYQEFKKKQQEEKAQKEQAQQNSPTLTPDEQRILERGEISDGQYAVGGIVGTFFGFGIGHAIQGHDRYSERGWIFTLGETVSLGLIIGGAVDCVSNSFDTYPYTTSSCNTGLLAGGIAAYYVFHIWEIIDVWVTAPLHNDEYRRVRDKVQRVDSGFSLYAAPVIGRNELQAGIGYHF